MDEKDEAFVSAIVPFLEQQAGQRTGSAAAITDGAAESALPAMELNMDGPDAVPISSSGNAVRQL